MRLWRRNTPASEGSSYATLAADLRQRRAARRNSVGAQPAVNAPEAVDVRDYQPEERLLERGAQTQQLVEDSRDIPRAWEPEESMPRPTKADGPLVRLSIFVGVLLGGLGAAIGLCLASDYAPTIVDGLVTLVICFITAVAAVWLRRIKGRSVAEKVEFGFVVVLGVMFIAYLKICVHLGPS